MFFDDHAYKKEFGHLKLDDREWDALGDLKTVLQVIV
jgi:hypothetical protein